MVVHHSHLAIKQFDGFAARVGFLAWVGGTGVDLVFLISGYIFCRMAGTRPFDGRSFFKNLFWRIYPNYWVFTGLVLLAHALHPGWNLGGNPYTLSSIIKSFLIIPQQIFPILILGWTLEQEMVFYSIFAAINALGKRRFLIPGLFCLGIVGLSHFPLGFWDYKFFSLFQVAFAFGALIFTHAALFRQCGWKLPLALALVGWSASVLTLERMGTGPWTEFVRVFGLSSSYGSLMVSLLNAGLVISFKSGIARWGVLIGEASYSLYLSHWFVLRRLSVSVSLAFPCAFFYEGRPELL